jgi:hypothetical protein
MVHDARLTTRRSRSSMHGSVFGYFESTSVDDQDEQDERDEVDDDADAGHEIEAEEADEVDEQAADDN